MYKIMIEIGKNYYYTGENISEWKNQIVKVLKNINMNVGTNKDVPVYECEDENGVIKNIVGSNLSDKTLNYQYAYGGMGNCFSESVERFPSFKNGRYMFEYTWGSN